MKKFVLIIITVLMIFSGVSCGNINKSDTELSSSDAYVTDESENNDSEMVLLNKKNQLFDQNNIQNSSIFLIDNGWLYGPVSSSYGKSMFIKVREDGSEMTILHENIFPHNINIQNGYLYYIGVNDNESGIYKMRTSGKDRVKISDACGSMQVTEENIYYTDNVRNELLEDENSLKITNPEDCHLFRCDLSGGNINEIISKPTFHFYVFDDYIIYQDDNDNSSLHICNIDGHSDVKLNDDISYFPICDSESIYYIKELKQGDILSRTIWKMNFDGTNDHKISDCSASNGFVVSEKYIYFVYYQDSDRIYRINKDGSDLTQISQDNNVTWLQLHKNKISYTTVTTDKKIDAFYFCNYDGSGKWNFREYE